MHQTIILTADLVTSWKLVCKNYAIMIFARPSAVLVRTYYVCNLGNQTRGSDCCICFVFAFFFLRNLLLLLLLTTTDYAPKLLNLHFVKRTRKRLLSSEYHHSMVFDAKTFVKYDASCRQIDRKYDVSTSANDMILGGVSIQTDKDWVMWPCFGAHIFDRNLWKPTKNKNKTRSVSGR